jgi:MoxR-like ATPase
MESAIQPKRGEFSSPEFREAVRATVAEVEKVIVGKREAVELALTALLCGGHCLIEDVPGVGKTMLARALAVATGCSFKRIQFTPDLLPSDVTGVSVFNQSSRDFEVRRGPVFANVLLADEINRATPKTQSALLECMEERQVTIDGNTHFLPEPFFVIATQNNVEMQGTYPLPEAQLDRFLLRMSIGYPKRHEEVAVLERQRHHHPIADVRATLNPEIILALQEEVRNVHLSAGVQEYIVEIAAATREHSAFVLGISPRGTLSLMHATQGWAALQGRNYAIPDDVKRLAPAVFGHRVIMRPEARHRGGTVEGVLNEIISATAVPGRS